MSGVAPKARRQPLSSFFDSVRLHAGERPLSSIRRPVSLLRIFRLFREPFYHRARNCEAKVSTRKKLSKRKKLMGDDLRRASAAHQPLKEAEREVPATAKLLRAFDERAARYADVFGNAQTPSELETATEILYEIATELNEIMTWVAPPGARPNGPFPTLEEALATWIGQRVITRQVADDIAQAATTRKGRPVRKRHLALQAYNLRHQNPFLSWAQLAKKVGYCEPEAEAYECRERLRKQVRELEKFLSYLSSGENT